MLEEAQPEKLLALLCEADRIVMGMRDEYKLHGHITDTSAKYMIVIRPLILKEVGNRLDDLAAAFQAGHKYAQETDGLYEDHCQPIKCPYLTEMLKRAYYDGFNFYYRVKEEVRLQKSY